MLDPKAVAKGINKIKPEIIFHMASQSFVSPSWEHPTLYMDANYKMTVNLFEGCLESNINPKIHIPGSGEEYGEINTGIESGKTITALSIAVFPMVRALPKAPNRLSNKVPNKRLIKRGKTTPPGRNRKNVLINEASNRGAPVTSQ